MARKITGGKYKRKKKRKLANIPGKPKKVIIGKEKKKTLRERGGNMRTILIATDKVDVLDPKTKKIKKATITAILENPSNRLTKDFLVKGSIINTTAGKARITNRPSREPIVQAVLVE